MTKLQEELIADNLHAFIANFGDVRIEQDTYNKGFYVYSPANAEMYVQYCYDISYLDGWLYGCVQGANKIVKQKEVIDVMTSDLMSLWKYLTDNQKEGEIKLSYNNQILRKTIENKTTYYDIYNVNGLIICCDGERVSFIEKNEENSFCYKSENADECFILSSEEKQHCIVEVIV